MTFLTTCIPFLDHPTDNHPTTIASIFFLVIGLTIPFDLRDLDTDESKLKTIPQLIGINNSIRLSQFNILIFCIFISIAASLTTIITSVIFSIISILLIDKIKTTRNQNYINFWIEGLPMMWLIIIYNSTLFTL